LLSGTSSECTTRSTPSSWAIRPTTESAPIARADANVRSSTVDSEKTWLETIVYDA
jgi:hypothetical protein